MTWDFRTLQGPRQIADFVASSSSESRICNISLEESAAYKAPQATQLEGTKDWSGWFQIQTMAESIHARRPTGHEAGNKNMSWEDQINVQHNCQGLREPTVLIIGAGQGGLTTAARLRQLHIDTVIIDQNACIGDNWRKRYQQLVLHDSGGLRRRYTIIWVDSLMQVFTPKDKLADWFTYYAGALALNVWMGATLTSSEWDHASRQWKVTLTSWKNGVQEDRTLRPRHIILATGHAGEPHLPSYITGLERFDGDRLVHSSKFTEPSKNAKGKKAVIVGSCNSAHNIGKNYYEHGYSVTMIQRSSTLVLTSETLIEVTMNGLYAEDGVSPIYDPFTRG
ncbi:MAG: hypothetical protein Q9188_005072 [Gyalolechia gomerana]